MAHDARATAPANMDVQADSLDGSGEIDPSLVMALLSITKSVRNLMGLKLAELDVYPGQDALLIALDANAPSMISHLAAGLAVRPSTTSKMIDVLELKGLVRRAPHKTDARRTLVHLTQLGVEKQGMVREVWHALEKDLRSDPDHNSILSRLQQIDQVLIRRLRRIR